MFLGLTLEKLLVFAVIVAFVLGPERMPAVASAFAGLVRRLKRFTGSARQRLRDEVGEDLVDVDWRKLDPRQYDPRRIIREALLDDAIDERPPPRQ